MGDAIILDFLAPFIARAQDEVSQGFFVRYSEGGPHIRFRFRTVRGAERAVQARIAVDWELFARATPFAGRGLQWTPYEPEVDRYGGPRGMAEAERFFAASTRFAVAALSEVVRSDRSARLGRAAIAGLTTIHALLSDPSRMRAFAESYEQGTVAMRYRAEAERVRLTETFDEALSRQQTTLDEYLGHALRRLQRNEPLTASLDMYRRAAKAYGRAIDRVVRDREFMILGRPVALPEGARHYLVSSTLHMTNNRLGIHRDEEAFLIRAIGRALS